MSDTLAQFDYDDIQGVLLKHTSLTRDLILELFKSHGKADHVDNTIYQLINYFSGRSQAATFLANSGYIWDSEIVLRSFYEAGSKVWFICFHKKEYREGLVKEFWTQLHSAHNHKRRTKAKIAEKTPHLDSKRIFEFLSREDIFDFGSSNKSARRAIDQKWSFSEILTTLEHGSDQVIAVPGILVLSHVYGLQSHLTHADDGALDFIQDQSTRPPQEAELKARAHVCRIMSDIASLWTLSYQAIRFHFEGTLKISEELHLTMNELHLKTAVHQEAFNRSQDAFYEKYNQESHPPSEQ